jgi:hypothetical protein
MRRPTWPVTAESGPAPAGKPDECFYCKVKIGGEHAADCVMRRRTVVCRISVDLVRIVPEGWDGEMIDFQMNDSSSCADNLLHEIDALAGRLGEVNDQCACHITGGTYLREADEADEAASRLWLDGRPAQEP